MEKIKVDINVESSTDILNKMYEDYLSCPQAIRYLSKIGLTNEQIIKDNIAKIWDFVSDLKYCAKCPGIEKCQKENPLFVTKVTYKSGYVDREITPCKQYLKRVQLNNQFLIRDFDEEILNVKLSELDKTKERMEIVSLYYEFKEKGINNWIYVAGRQNTGRSYTASVLASDAAKNNLGPIIFANSPRRINELTDMYFNDKDRFKKELDRFIDVPILILDDFGNEVKNDIVRDAIVFPIISNRANKKLITIFTSDFNINDLISLYSTNKAGQIRGDQIKKILKGMCKKEINLGDLGVY